MKKIIIAVFIFTVCCSMLRVKSIPTFEPVAVIELFTSQGCSSCPAADRLLSQTIVDANKTGKKIFALSFHVDYWNRLGWSDPFSDKKYSERQHNYAIALNLNSVYTPQAIVNGKTEFVGSGETALHAALTSSLNEKSQAGFKSLAATAEQGKPIHIYYTLDGNYVGCKINFALVSLTETTAVKHGENGGRVLKNDNVVRQFITIPSSATGEVSFAANPIPEKNNMAIIAYLQRIKDLKIIGAEMAKINL